MTADDKSRTSLRYRWACRAAALALVAATAVSHPAMAQPARDPAAAEALFLQGKDLLKQGRTKEACVAFEGSMKADPSGGTLLNIARCHEMDGKTATAWAEYRKAIGVFKADGDERRVKSATKFADELEAKLSKLTVTATTSHEGLVIKRNGVELSSASLGNPIPVDPGDQRIEASAPGLEPWAKTVNLGADGDAQTVVVPDLSASTPEGPAPPDDGGDGSAEGDSGINGGMIAGIALGVVGVGAVVAGSVIGASVLGDASDLEDPSLCPDKLCNEDGQDKRDSAETKALASNLLIGIGGAATVGGVILIILFAGDDAEAEVAGVRVQPVVGPQAQGLMLRGSF